MKVLNYQIISTILALLGVFLAAKQNSLKWPLGIIANCIAIIVYKDSGLYIKAILANIFILDSFYGWYQWMYGGYQKSKLPVTKSKPRTLIILFILGSFLIYLSGLITHKYTLTTVSYWEAFAILSIIAHWMMARKKIENWFIWIGLDILYINICIYKSLYIFAFKYLIYTIMAIYGYNSWKKTLTKLRK